MNHRLYEEWLFADQGTLSREQSAAVQEHLRDCPDCQALAGSWQEVQAVLRDPPVAAPAAGFSSRWQMRLAAERGVTHRRQTQVMLGLTIGGALALLAVLITLAWPWLQVPGVFWWTWLYRLFMLIAYAGAIQEFFLAMFRAATGDVPVVWWVLFTGLLCELGVLWIVSFRLLTNPRRITQ
jgi:anti-sigma factor RsiW